MNEPKTFGKNCKAQRAAGFYWFFYWGPQNPAGGAVTYTKKREGEPQHMIRECGKGDYQSPPSRPTQGRDPWFAENAPSGRGRRQAKPHSVPLGIHFQEFDQGTGIGS